jgi:ubiquinol-cytochrome c reductase iron-sulfur subunit
MGAAQPMTDRPAIDRRRLLYLTTAAVGAFGVAAAAWPFIDQMNPDAGMRASGDVVDVNLDELRLGQRRVVHWHHVPISVVHRTPAMLAAMQDTAFVARLVDPQSEHRQQPPYAMNWHRSTDPAYAVLVGVCTWCGVIPQYLAEASPPDVVGGYFCPSCASHYDPAGRAHAGVARYNLAVPPFAIERSRLVIGKNTGGEIFTLESVERI